MKGTIYGYARVSTMEQKEDRQIFALREKGVDESNIYLDKISGKDFNRKMYRLLTQKLRPGDLLYVKSIDRLGRNYRDIIEQWRFLTMEKQIDIVILDMSLLDTRKGKDLMGTFLSDIVLQVLSFVAENERVNIRQRQREGIAMAKRRGIHLGRPLKKLPSKFVQIYDQWWRRQITGKEAARRCRMPLSTFYRKAKEHREDLEKK
jgi:DNA invertase Pin-like site-specific DNA recombinase